MSVTQKGALTLTPVPPRTLHYCNIIPPNRNKNIQASAVVGKERERKKERRTKRKRIIKERAKGRKGESKMKAPKIPI